MVNFFKVLVIFVAIIFLPFSTLAQLKIIVDGDNIDLNGTIVEHVGLSSELDLKESFYAINESGSSISVKVRRTEVDVLDGTKNSTCWIFCPLFEYSGIEEVLVSSLSASIPVNDTNFSFVAHYRPENLDGCSLMRYEWIDEATESIVYATVDIKFSHSTGTCLLGVNDLKNNIEVSLAPNPAADNVLLTLEGTSVYDQISIDIFDLLGKKVTTISQVGPKNNLDISGFNNGLYFISIMKNESLIKTSKLIKE